MTIHHVPLAKNNTPVYQDNKLREASREDIEAFKRKTQEHSQPESFRSSNGKNYSTNLTKPPVSNAQESVEQEDNQLSQQLNLTDDVIKRKKDDSQNEYSDVDLQQELASQLQRNQHHMMNEGVGLQKSSNDANVSIDSKVVNELAERILVSHDPKTSSGEVRIKINSSLLENTEIQLFNKNGELNIIFNCQSATDMTTLSRNESMLIKNLSQNLDSRIHFEIREGATTDKNLTHSGQEDRRSKGEYISEWDDE